jgi:hypothetical protein
VLGCKQFIERTELGSDGQQIVAEWLKDNPRRLGKGHDRLVGVAPLRGLTRKGWLLGGRIHQFLWRRSRVAGVREKGTEAAKSDEKPF